MNGKKFVTKEDVELEFKETRVLPKGTRLTPDGSGKLSATANGVTLEVDESDASAMFEHVEEVDLVEGDEGFEAVSEEGNKSEA